jgi:hypothetical protein
VKTAFQFILAALLVTAGHSIGCATETGTMICSGGIISIGNTAGEVIGKCGQPATSTTREEKRVIAESENSRDRLIKTVAIDDWTFNFGPNQFQYQLLLENGRVARIDSLDYGY